MKPTLSIRGAARYDAESAQFLQLHAAALVNTATNGLWVGTNQLVAGVLPDSHAANPGGNGGNQSPQTGLYAVALPASRIVIKGTVVIPGDLVIQGTITGQGTFYVGGNLYIASNLTYAHGPDFSSPPETQTASARDTWVANSMTNDLVAYAVRGSILAGMSRIRTGSIIVIIILAAACNSWAMKRTWARMESRARLTTIRLSFTPTGR